MILLSVPAGYWGRFPVFVFVNVSEDVSALGKVVVSEFCFVFVLLPGFTSLRVIKMDYHILGQLAWEVHSRGDIPPS